MHLGRDVNVAKAPKLGGNQYLGELSWVEEAINFRLRAEPLDPTVICLLFVCLTNNKQTNTVICTPHHQRSMCWQIRMNTKWARSLRNDARSCLLLHIFAIKILSSGKSQTRTFCFPGSAVMLFSAWLIAAQNSDACSVMISESDRRPWSFRLPWLSRIRNTVLLIRSSKTQGKDGLKTTTKNARGWLCFQKKIRVKWPCPVLTFYGKKSSDLSYIAKGRFHCSCAVKIFLKYPNGFWCSQISNIRIRMYLETAVFLNICSWMNSQNAIFSIIEFEYLNSNKNPFNTYSKRSFEEHNCTFYHDSLSTLTKLKADQLTRATPWIVLREKLSLQLRSQEVPHCLHLFLVIPSPSLTIGQG